jgi:hypothetical protein
MKVHPRRIFTWVLACVAAFVVVINVSTFMKVPGQHPLAEPLGLGLLGGGDPIRGGSGNVIRVGDYIEHKFVQPPLILRMRGTSIKPQVGPLILAGQNQSKTFNNLKPAAIGGKSNVFDKSAAEKELPKHPISKSDIEIWPDPNKPYHDRILKQINYYPPLAAEYEHTNQFKTILAYSGLGETPKGRAKFLKDDCLVQTCYLTDELKAAESADIVLYQNDIFESLWFRRPANQIWVLWVLESPMYSMNFRAFRDYINWTATYRPDSTLVTPYEKFVLFKNFTKVPKQPRINYATGKTKKIAWFSSNCTPQNKRTEYVEELKKHISVDIYGACGDMECPRFESDKCNHILKEQYKFYLAFENSNCAYYIPEKLFWNALW